MIGHRPISTSQHHPGAQRRQLRTGAIEAEQGQRGHGGRKPGKGMNLATSPQNECENRRRRPSRGLAHTPGTPIFALFRWTSERAASIRCPDGGSGQGSFASFLKGPLPPSGHRIERRTIDLQSDINCLPERSLLGAFGKQHDDYDHDVFNSAGSTLATPHFGPENGVHVTLLPLGSEPVAHGSVPAGRQALPCQGWFRGGGHAPVRPYERIALPPTPSLRRRAARERASTQAGLTNGSSLF